MAVSKRVRYEVLSRDGFACRYCHADDVPLTLDHVVPSVLGGSDLPDNLVACCRDCNAGKTSVSPTSETVADVSDDAVRWAAARQRAVQIAAERRESADERRQPFLDEWHTWDHDGSYLPSGWEGSVDQWLDAGITTDQLIEAISITTPRRDVPHGSVFRYIGGIVKRWLAELDDLTAQELQRGDDH